MACQEEEGKASRRSSSSEECETTDPCCCCCDDRIDCRKGMKSGLWTQRIASSCMIVVLRAPVLKPRADMVILDQACLNFFGFFSSFSACAIVLSELVCNVLFCLKEGRKASCLDVTRAGVARRPYGESSVGSFVRIDERERGWVER